MKKNLLLFLFILFTGYRLHAQVFPHEGDTLNYRIIGFRIPSDKKVHEYKLEIASGSYNREDSFKKNIVFSKGIKTDRVIGEVPAFGKQYTWHIVDPENKSVQNIFYHFSTGSIRNLDTAIARLRIVKKAETYKDGYIFMDGTRALYDMNGNPVWYFPNVEHFQNPEFEVRNINTTPQGTITFIVGVMAYDVDYNASVLWRGAGNNKTDGDLGYHHQIERLPNGHYMILGNENVICRKPALPDSNFVIMSNSGQAPDNSSGNYANTPFGTVLEFDEKGNIVWRWSSVSYFKGSDLVNYRNQNGFPDIITHQNGFYFDKKTKMIYVSFRNISRIIKVKYPEGDVAGVYGELFKKGVPEKGNGLFCRQHSCKISDKGYLYMFNNNVCNQGALPSIVMFEEPKTQNGSLKKIWEYQCTIDGIPEETKQKQYQFVSGGNVTELPDHSIFVTMCAPFYCKIFIVNKDKKILWSAIPERKNPTTKKWETMNLYQANIISREQMEHMIWSAETK